MITVAHQHPLPGFLPERLSERLVDSTSFPVSATSWRGYEDRRRRYVGVVHHPDDPLLYDQVELDGHLTYSTIRLDVDLEDAVGDIFARVFTGEIPEPSLLTENPETGHAHAVYCLADPVLREPRQSSNNRLRRAVTEGLTALLGADPAYSEVLTQRPDCPRFETYYMGGKWRLGDLRRWSEPAYHQAVAERRERGGYLVHPRIWQAGLRWIGRRVFDELQTEDIEDAIERLASELEVELEPAGPGCVLAVARRLDGVRHQWAQFPEGFSPTFRGTQARRGRKSGKVRRAAVAGRDRAIANLYRQGNPQRRIAEIVGCSQTTVSYVLRRDGVEAPPRGLAAQQRGQLARLLSDRGWSQRRIATEIGVDHRTVGRSLERIKGHLEQRTTTGGAKHGSKFPSGGMEVGGGPRVNVSDAMSDESTPKQEAAGQWQGLIALAQAGDFESAELMRLARDARAAARAGDSEAARAIEVLAGAHRARRR